MDKGEAVRRAVIVLQDRLHALRVDHCSRCRSTITVGNPMWGEFECPTPCAIRLDVIDLHRRVDRLRGTGR